MVVNMIAGFIHFILKAFWNTTVILVCACLVFTGFKSNQPMTVPDAPEGMTYFEFVADRIDAAKTVEPSRCGWGMMLSLATLGPIYSIIYTEVGIHPDGVLARGTTPDPDIPKNVAGAQWYEMLGIWWNTIERLSWTMVGKPAAYG
jgi:hypothetical protein